MQGNYPLRGFIQFAPNSSALFMHRVAGGKYDPKSDEKRPVSLISLPSCGYFRSRGWNPYFLAGSHAKRPPVDHSSGCNYNLHNLHSSALKCSGYNTRKFNGKRTVPVFKVSLLLEISKLS